MAVYFNEGFAPVCSYDVNDGLLRKIAKEVQLAANPNWTIHYPTDIEDVTNLLVLRHQLNGPENKTKDVFVEFYQPIFVQRLNAGGTALEDVLNRKNYYYAEVVYGIGNYTPPDPEDDVDEDGYYTTPGAWEEDMASVRSRFSWFRHDTASTIKKWLPVQFWVSLTDDVLSIVVAGDASANKLDRLISFGYFGKIKPFKNSKERWSSNFGVTVGSDVPPNDYLTQEEKNRYSDKTGTGVTDICMLETFTGFPMQAHMAAFTTPDEFVDKKLEGPSNYTDKYHMSPVYVFHGFDGYRGELKGIVATDRSTVVNKDDLIHKYNSETGQEEDPDTQDIYKVFLVNAPYSFLTNATNVMYGVAILKKTEPYTEAE